MIETKLQNLKVFFLKKYDKLTKYLRYIKQFRKQKKPTGTPEKYKKCLVNHTINNLLLVIYLVHDRLNLVVQIWLQFIFSIIYRT